MLQKGSCYDLDDDDVNVVVRLWLNRELRGSRMRVRVKEEIEDEFANKLASHRKQSSRPEQPVIEFNRILIDPGVLTLITSRFLNIRQKKYVIKYPWMRQKAEESRNHHMLLD